MMRPAMTPKETVQGGERKSRGTRGRDIAQNLEAVTRKCRLGVKLFVCCYSASKAYEDDLRPCTKVPRTKVPCTVSEVQVAMLTL
jgi:hypothetical protein